MSYQVLARKWRPKSFGTLVGQEHVVRALSHALATGRLHHAWLFTGTRGVGKTTISRILAKALNCETGVTAEPCGQCAACQAIDADRFPDYVEMDAASNRGVDDMAALLDKAVYAPTQGRYKVYMIDEVHMLTGHAFNAMLKTLEEPPEHVKFILATTDPQKIPVTVLSRCLQFNLKQMPPGHIVEHLDRILHAEGVPFEPAALRHLAKAAHGSMRDALSLLDQAIAHGAGKVEEEQVIHMLGTVGDDHLLAVLDALLAGDVEALLAVAEGMAARSLSFDAGLQSLASLLHRIAVLQFAPAALSDPVERGRLQPYAEGFDAEFLQLAYQIAIHGRDELGLAPDEQAGFTMSLLRLHAFRPDSPPALGGEPRPSGGAGGSGRAQAMPAGAVRTARPELPAARTEAPGERPAPEAVAAVPVQPGAATISPEQPASAPQPAMPAPVGAAVAPERPVEMAAPVQPASQTADIPPWEALPPEAFETLTGLPASDPPLRAPVSPAPSASAAGSDTMPAGNEGWHELLQALQLGGMVRELAQHCEWLGQEADALRLRLSHAHRHLLDLNPAHAERLQEQLRAHFGRPVRVRIDIGEIADATPAQRDQAHKQQRHAQAVAALEADAVVRELIERFDATLLEATVRAR